MLWHIIKLIISIGILPTIKAGVLKSSNIQNLLNSAHGEVLMSCLCLLMDLEMNVTVASILNEKAVQLPSGGSITIIAVTTLSGGDITHAVPDNTGYITEGQLFLRNDTDTGKVIVDPFRSLSRLKQLVIGKKTREDHPQVMNAAVRLYSDAAGAKTKLENGFDLSDYDERALAFAKEYSDKLLSIDVNIDITEMLDTAWSLFAKHFKKSEVTIKSELVAKYWPEA